MMRKKVNGIKEGSLFLTILLALLFFGTFIGIIIHAITLFSSLTHLQGTHYAQLYAAEALMHYGIAQVINNNKLSSFIVPVWPSPTAKTIYNGNIIIQKDNDDTFFLTAHLIRNTIILQTVECFVRQEKNGLVVIYNWCIK